MKFCVINGSPKGKYSITLQSIRYLEKIFDMHQFEIFNVGLQIKSLEKDMNKVIAGMNEADAIIFSYPVYTFIAPAQLHRFIELIKENNVDLNGKYVTQLSTSKHFYDVTAHKYIEDNCYDLNMKVIKGLSADMDDLLTKKGQIELESFFNYVVNSIENDIYEFRTNNETIIKEYTPSFEFIPKKDGKKVVIVTDLLESDNNLKNMIDDFINIFSYEASIVNIREYPFAGGCLGCFRCAADGTCIYKDKFDSFLRDNIQSADAIVIAFTIKDHSMGARFKMYDDRQFCNGHRTVTEGMPFGYIVNGNYEGEFNLKTIVEGRAEVGGNFLSGVGYNSQTIKNMAQKLEYAIDNKYVIPRNFYGVGGMKIFRDLIWIMRGIMHADHKFYKKHGVYDFPQKQRSKMIGISMLGLLLRNKKIMAKAGNKMNEGMLMPYNKFFAKMDKKKIKKR